MDKLAERNEKNIMMIELEGIEKKIKINADGIKIGMDDNILKLFIRKNADKRIFSFKENFADNRTVFQSIIDGKINRIVFFSNKNNKTSVFHYDVIRKNSAGLTKKQSLYVEVVIDKNVVKKI